MGSSLEVKIVSKDDKYISRATTLLVLYTTPSRELAENVSIVYGGEYMFPDDKDEERYDELTARIHKIKYLTATPSEEEIAELAVLEDEIALLRNHFFTKLDRETLSEIITFYANELNESRKTIARYTVEIDKLETRITKAKNTEIYNTIEEQISDLKSSIEYFTEEIERLTWLHNLWTNAVQYVWDENKDSTLYYFYS